jgi:hypothetical protein
VLVGAYKIVDGVDVPNVRDLGLRRAIERLFFAGDATALTSGVGEVDAAAVLVLVLVLVLVVVVVVAFGVTGATSQSSSSSN